MPPTGCCRRPLTLAGVAVVCGLGALCPGAHAQPQIALPDWSPQAKQIENVLWDAIAAVQDGESAALADLLADPAMVIGVRFEGGAPETQVITAADRDQVVQWMAQNPPPVDMVFEAIEVTMFGPNAGLAVVKVSTPRVAESLAVACLTMVQAPGNKATAAGAEAEPEWRIATMMIPR